MEGFECKKQNWDTISEFLNKHNIDAHYSKTTLLIRRLRMQVQSKEVA